MGKQTDIGIRIRADGKGAVGTFRLTREELDKLADSAKDVDKNTGKAGRSLKQMAKDSVSLKGSLTAAAVAGGAIASIGAGLYALVNDFTQTAKAADNYSRALGISVESLTAWQYAAQDVGIQSDKIADIFKDTAEKIGDAYANGGGEAVDALDALGLSVSSLVKMSPDKQLMAIAQQLDNVGTQAEKIQILESLASDASLLLPLLDNDAARLKELTAEAEAFGMVLDQEAVAAARQFDDQMRQLKANAGGLSRELVEDLLPGLNEITSAMVEAAKDGGPLLALWVGMGGAMSQLIFGTEIQQAADDVKDLQGELETLQFRLEKNKEGAGGWLGDTVRGVVHGTKEEIEAEIAQTEAALKASMARLAQMKKDLLNPPAPTGAPVGGSGAGGPPGGTKKSYTDATAAIGGWVASLEQAREAIGKTGPELAILNANAKINAEIAKATAAGNTKAAAAWESRRAGILALVEATEEEKTAEQELAAELDAAIKMQEAMEKTYDDRKKAGGELVKSLQEELDLTQYHGRELAIQTKIRAAHSQGIWDQDDAIRSLTGSLYDEAAAAQAATDAAEDFKNTQRDIANSLTDALMRGFEDGKDFAANFIDTLKNMFQTLVLRPIIQPIATSVAGGITGMLMPGSASAGGGLGGIGDLLSLGQKVGGLFGGGATAASLGSSSAAALSAFGGSGGTAGALTAFGGAGAPISGAIGTAGSTGGAGLMGSLGGALPWIGGGLAIASMLGVFDKKPSDKTQWAGFTGGDNTLFAGGEDGKKFSQENRDAATQMAEALNAFNSSLDQYGALTESLQVKVGGRDGILVQASNLSQSGQLGQTPNGSAVLDDVTDIYQGSSAEAALSAAFDHIWDQFLDSTEQFGESMITLLRGLTDPDDRLAGASAFSTLQATAIDADPVADYAAAVEQANRSLWQAGQDQYTTIMDLTAAYDGSLAATQELAAATQARYQTEIALLQQIDAAISSTDALFASSRQQFDLAGLSAEETYNYWKSLADGGAAELANLIDPAAIEQQIAQVGSQYMAAWGVLNEAQQAAMKPEYQAYIDELETLRDERLGAAREQLDDQTASVARETNQALSDASARFLEAAKRIEEAATTINTAAATPTPVTVSLADIFTDQPDVGGA